MPVKSGEPCTSREWSWVDHRGSFRNTTVNGQIAGFGLDLGVIDDAIIMRFDVRRECARVTAFCAIWRLGWCAPALRAVTLVSPYGSRYPFRLERADAQSPRPCLGAHTMRPTP